MKRLFKSPLSTWTTILTLGMTALPTQAYAVDSQTDIGSLQDVFKEFIGKDGILIVWLPAIATLYVMISGYRYMISQGNPELAEKAKKSLTYAVYGMIIAYAGTTIILFVSDVLHLS